MNWIFAYSFVLGVATFFSPCALPLLPAYISYFFGRDEGKGGGIKYGIKYGMTTALGILAVFIPLGIIGGSMSYVLVPYISRIEPIVGVILIILGIALLFDISFSIHFNKSVSKNYLGMLVFGVIYGSASLACGLPLLISAFLGAVESGGFFSGFASMISYALGICTLMVIVTVAISLGKNIKSLLKYMPLIRKVCSGVIIIIGIMMLAKYIVQV